jgi:hypothetical protein
VKPKFQLLNSRQAKLARKQKIPFLLVFALVLWTFIPSLLAQTESPSLGDFWEGRVEWIVDIFDVKLPMGEGDTIAISDTEYWSYLHANNTSFEIIDQCGEAAAFPGCVTLWQSEDAGASFNLLAPICLIPCEACPCDDQRDHITTQQYPRVARAEDGTWYMAYEWHAQIILRRSTDGMTWSDFEYLLIPGGVWPRDVEDCDGVEDIGEHPNIRGEGDVCLVGGPPGLYIEGGLLYVFAMAGSAPSHMRCYKGDRFGDLGNLQPCETDPLFTGATTYGEPNVFGEDALAYFDFRYISSADIFRDGEYYYMTYEGVRGPSALELGRDDQFGLGFARAGELDSEWERYPGNPVLMGLVDNWGIGHADLLSISGTIYLYTATSMTTRGRYRLEWK